MKGLSQGVAINVQYKSRPIKFKPKQWPSPFVNMGVVADFTNLTLGNS